MKKEVLGIKIDDITMKEALETVEDWLKGRDKHYIVTPNPEIVVMAQKDEGLKKIINQADLAIPDGKGLRLTTDIVCNIPGIDFMEELIKMASEKGFTTGFLGGRDGVAEKVAERLKKKYPKLIVRYALEGPVIPAPYQVRGKLAGIYVSEGKESSAYTNKDLWIPDQVRDDKVGILFVAFGPPKQEKWIAKNIDRINVKVAMGVGGAFDYLSGKIPRAPKWLRDLNLEWLFRVIIQPWRIKRQLALIKYIWLIASR